VSNIRIALEGDSALFPSFFVFFLPIDHQRIDLPMVRRFFGEELFKSMCTQLAKMKGIVNVPGN
jgi:hypothetical protein